MKRAHSVFQLYMLYVGAAATAATCMRYHRVYDIVFRVFTENIDKICKMFVLTGIVCTMCVGMNLALVCRKARQKNIIFTF